LWLFLSLNRRERERERERERKTDEWCKPSRGGIRNYRLCKLALSFPGRHLGLRDMKTEVGKEREREREREARGF